MVTARHVFQSRMGSMLAWPFATFITKIQSVGRGIAVVPLALAAVVWAFIAGGKLRFCGLLQQLLPVTVRCHKVYPPKRYRIPASLV
eukprot:scaffold1261_cov50-Cyclotella_meneghiniana.AAC.2